MDAREHLHNLAIIYSAGPVAQRWAMRVKAGGWRWAPSRDQIFAIHEAGHAMAAHVFGNVVYAASIVEHFDVKVGSGHLGGIVTLNPSAEMQKGVVYKTDRQVVVELATFLELSTDWRAVLSRIRTIQTETQHLIEQHWRPITELADELNRHRELDQAAILQVLGRRSRGADGLLSPTAGVTPFRPV